MPDHFDFRNDFLQGALPARISDEDANKFFRAARNVRKINSDFSNIKLKYLFRIFEKMGYIKSDYLIVSLHVRQEKIRVYIRDRLIERNIGIDLKKPISLNQIGGIFLDVKRKSDKINHGIYFKCCMRELIDCCLTPDVSDL